MNVFPNGSSFSHWRFPLYYQVDPAKPQPAKPSAANPEPLYQCYPVEPTPPKTSFSLWNAAKETVKGVFRPITPLFKHPFKSALTIAATVAVASVAPVTVPFMVLAGLGIGGVQTVQGVRSALREYSQGNYEAAEKAFGQIGEGGFSVVSSLLGIRQAGAIAAEAKASRLALNTSASVADKLKAVESGIQAAQKVQAGPWSNALHETVSILSTSGLKTTAAQLNPFRIAAIAKGKFQAFVALFKQNPVTDMEAAVQQAQRHLRIKSTDAPEFVPHVDQVKGLGGIGKVHGAYTPKTHEVHIQQDRWKAFQELLGPFGNKNPLATLPKPIQRFLGNLHAQRISATELATHEMTHARQFIQVRKMSAEQARQAVQTAFPEQSPDAVKKFLELLSFKGSVGQATRHPKGEQYLLDKAQQYFQTKQLLRQLADNPTTVNQLQTKHKLFKAYFRAQHEIEARQAAAQAIIADAIKQLKLARGFYQNDTLLKQYRAARIEAKLNKLLTKFNRLEKAGLIPQAAQVEQQLGSLAQIQKTGTSTYTYLQNEQILQRHVQAVSRIQQVKEQTRAIQSGQVGILTTIKNLVGGILSRIVRFFSPTGVQQFERQNQSLRPAYVAFNAQVHRNQSQSQRTFFS